MSRNSQLIKYPQNDSQLSKAAGVKVRKYYKQLNGLPKKLSNELLFSHMIANDLITTNTKDEINYDKAYNILIDIYNNNVEIENNKKNIIKKEARKQARKQTREQKKALIPIAPIIRTITFIMHYELETQYSKMFFDRVNNTITHTDEKIISNHTTEPTTYTGSNFSGFIDEMVNNLNTEQSHKTTRCINHSVEKQDAQQIAQNSMPQIRQPMKRSYILRNDWLKFSGGISNTAYEETTDRCVYHQLNEYLTNPQTGNPSKFVNRRRMSQEALFLFFQETINDNDLQEEYPDFSMDSGVSAELIKYLCINLKRNMYAFDETEKTFHTLDTHTSKNYSPIVFYKIHGHCYLIDDPSVIKSVATSNAMKGNKILTTTLTDEKEEKVMEVFHIEKYNVSNSKDMTEGIYLLNQSNLDKEIVEFIQTFQSIPRTKTNKSNIIEIKFEEGFEKRKKDKKFVIICIDATFNESFDYKQIANVAQYNNIKYVNEGVGSLILSILEAGGRSCREYLTNNEREKLIRSYGSICAMCKLSCEKYEIDHIKPLAGGGDNTIANLQPLCISCHTEKTNTEKLDGSYKNKDIEVSVFNQVVLDNIVKKNEWKTWAFVETVPIELSVENNEDVQKYKYDMRKCRKNISYYSKYEFPVYSVMDIPVPFTGNLKCGMFYVNTKNIYPFRGCGWYSYPIVEYGLSVHLIHKDNIIMEFIPSVKLPPSHFRKSIDTLMKSFETEPALQKLSVNSLIGLFGKTKRTTSATKFSLCKYEAAKWWGDKDPKCEVFIKNIKLDNEEILYNGIFTEPVDVEGIKYCLYKQVLEMEALELHKLESIIKNKGGIILDRNTDAIRYARHSEIEIVEYWDDEKNVLKYQKEQSKPLSCEMLPHLCRKHELDLTVFNLKWNIKYDYDCPYEEASRIVDTDCSIHIDGRAGTGKTFLVNLIIDELKSRDKNYICFSPTNKGALLIKGNTIHSVYYKFQSCKKVLFSKLEKVDYIFIDEVSMMIKDFYQLFILIKRSFPKMNFIIAGDFGQLPPVNDDWIGDYENSPAMHGLCDGNKTQLLICRRADKKLFELCKNVEDIDIKDYPIIEDTYINLAYTHDTRKKVNDKCMKRYMINKTGVFIKKDPANPKTQDITVCAGMPIIAHKTNKGMNILNSQQFIIHSIVGDDVMIMIGNELLNISIYRFHKYFYLGFCITIHASQGETIDGKYTIYDWKFNRFCSKAKYVALSRGTNIENIQIVA
jgi:DNA replication protein DnaC